jgi:hypothetical protein
MPLTYERVVREALTLPEVEQSTSYGTAALKVRGKLMIRLKEDGETIVVRTTWEARERLMTLHPECFFLTDHYVGHPWVLLKLKRASLGVFKPVLVAAWRICASKALLKAHPELAHIAD